MRKTGTCVVLRVCVFCVFGALFARRAILVCVRAHPRGRMRGSLYVNVRPYEVLLAGPRDRSIWFPTPLAIISCRAGPGLAGFLQIFHCCRGTLRSRTRGTGRRSTSQPPVALGGLGELGAIWRHLSPAFPTVSIV